MYVKEDIKCSIVELSKDFSKCCSIVIKIDKGRSINIKCVYRSPNSSTENNNGLLQLLQEISDYDSTYKLVLGDFNLPNINWENYTITEGNQSFSFMVISLPNMSKR